MRPVAVMLGAWRPEFGVECKACLARHPEFRLVGVAADAAAMLAHVAAEKPDVLVFEADLPGAGGLSVIPGILLASPGTRVLPVHSSCADKYVCAAIEYGAAGCLSRRAVARELRAAVTAAHAGEFWAHRGLLAHLLRSMIAERHTAEGADGALLGPLTSREREIVVLMRDGMTNKEIGNALGISGTTVKTHAQHVLHKLHLSRRMELLKEPSVAAAPAGGSGTDRDLPGAAARALN